MAVFTKTRTSVKTKVAIALASGVVLAAAAAGIYEVDKKTFLQEGVARQEIVQEIQDVTYYLKGPVGDAYYASISFNTSVDIPPKANIMVLLPPGLNVDNSTVTIDGSLIGGYYLSQQGRLVVINRDGEGEVIPKGKTIQMLIGKIVVSDKELLAIDITAEVSIQYSMLPRQLPELGVSDIYLEGNIVTIILHNKGVDVDTKNFRISIESDGDLNRNYLVGTLADKRFLMAGGTSKLQPSVISETITVSVCVDSQNQIEELDESNNCLKRKLDVVEEVAQDMEDYPEDIKEIIEADKAKELESLRVDGDKKNEGDVGDSRVEAEMEEKEIADLKNDDDNDGDVATTGLLEIISPNGGEVVSSGETIEILWKGDASRIQKVTLSVLKGHDQIGFISQTLPNSDGAYLWKIPESMSVSGAYVRIVGYDNKTKTVVEDTSDGKFEIARVSASKGRDTSDDTKSGGVDSIGGIDAGEAEVEAKVVDEPVTTRRGGSGGGSPAVTASVLGFNKLIKLKCPAAATYDVNHPCRTVYYYSTLGTRHAFPNSKVFFTWYSGFDEVNIISKEAMADIALGQNVTYHPGTRMVKFQTSDMVYTVSLRGLLRGVETEVLATQLYGIAWNTKIDDIGDAFFTDYSFGAPLITAEDYSASAAIQSAMIINDSI